MCEVNDLSAQIPGFQSELATLELECSSDLSLRGWGTRREWWHKPYTTKDEEGKEQLREQHLSFHLHCRTLIET